MSATMLSAAETATNELNKGSAKRVIVESEYCRLIIIGSGPKSLVVALTAANSGLGLILVELKKSARKIDEMLK